MSKFKLGDKVRKITGYPFTGTVCAIYDHEEKCVVKHKDKWEHIFSDKQLVYDHEEYQYLDLLKECLEEGDYRQGRNGNTYSLFGKQIRFDLSSGLIPLLTTKKIHFKSVVVELLWMLNGDTNIKYLNDNGVTIWDEWADISGDLGPIYGKQWRDFNGKDQLYELCQNLLKDPFSRRHVVSAWNPGELDKMALPPCHCLFQFYVVNGKLNCQLYQRSADIFLGVPFNIASYSLLTLLIANEVGLKPGSFIHTFGDVHLYENHKEQALEQINREPRLFPQISWDKRKNISCITYEDFKLENYNPHSLIKGDVSI